MSVRLVNVQIQGDRVGILTRTMNPPEDTSPSLGEKHRGSPDATSTQIELSSELLDVGTRAKPTCVESLRSFLYSMDESSTMDLSSVEKDAGIMSRESTEVDEFVLFDGAPSVRKSKSSAGLVSGDSFVTLCGRDVTIKMVQCAYTQHNPSSQLYNATQISPHTDTHIQRMIVKVLLNAYWHPNIALTRREQQ